MLQVVAVHAQDKKRRWLCVCVGSPLLLRNRSPTPSFPFPKPPPPNPSPPSQTFTAPLRNSPSQPSFTTPFPTPLRNHPFTTLLHKTPQPPSQPLQQPPSTTTLQHTLLSTTPQEPPSTTTSTSTPPPLPSSLALPFLIWYEPGPVPLVERSPPARNSPHSMHLVHCRRSIHLPATPRLTQRIPRR